MLSEKYKISASDIVDIDIDSIIELSGQNAECFNYFYSFNKRVKEATDVKTNGIFSCLCVICLMHLTDDRNNPYGERNNYTLTLSSFDDSDIDIINNLIRCTHAHDLLARLYDFLWLLKPSNKYEDGKSAITHYINSAANLINSSDNWVSGSYRLKRSFVIAKQLKEASELDKIFHLFQEYAEPLLTSYFPLQIIEYLLDLRIIRSYSKECTDLLTRCIESCKNTDIINHQMISSYYELLYRVFNHLKKFEEVKKNKRLCALSEINHSVAITESGGEIVASVMHLKMAVKLLKEIPEEKELLDRTLKQLLEVQKKIPASLKPITIDMDTKRRDQFIKLLENKDFYTACRIFFVSFRQIKMSEIELYVQNMQNSIHSIFSGEIVNELGRTIGIRESSHSDSQKAKIQDSYDYLHIYWQTQVNSILLPFLNYINNDIMYSRLDIQRIVCNNPAIDEQSESLFIDGLCYGLSGDFSTALHLLIPQTEHMLRYLLNQRGISTTTLKNGIQDEIDINVLLDRNQEYRLHLDTILSPELTLDLEALLIAKGGANLRNRIAHGLVNYLEANNAPYSIYFVGLIFTVVFLGWVIQTQHESKDTNSSEDI